MKIFKLILGIIFLGGSFFASIRLLNSAKSIVEYIPTLIVLIISIYLIKSSFNKKKLKTKKSQIVTKTKEEYFVLNKKTEDTPIKSSNKNDITREIYNEKIELLKRSLEMNLISKAEFDSKVIDIENEKKKIEKEEREAEIEIRNFEKLEKNKSALKKLYEANVITKEELIFKIQEQKNIVYDIEKDTLLNVKPSPELKNKTTEKNIIISFSIGLVILIVALIFNKLPEHTKIESDIYYENQIQFFLTAETQENLLDVIGYFDLNNVTRCWTILNPSYDELRKIYQKRWRETSHTALSINFINKKQTRMFDANIDYQFYNEEEKEWIDSNRTIRFEFGQSNKIIEVYDMY